MRGGSLLKNFDLGCNIHVGSCILQFSGFTSVKELTLDVQNVIAPPREKYKAKDEKASTIESPTAAASPNNDIKSEKPQIMNEQAVENGSANYKGEDDLAKSTPNSPVARSAIESPPREFPDFNFDKAMDADASPRNKDYQRFYRFLIIFCIVNIVLIDAF